MNPSHPSTRAPTSVDSLHIHTLRQSLPYYTYTYTIIDQHIKDLDASTDWRRSGLDCVGTAEGDSLMSPDPYTCVSLHARDHACTRGTAGRRASHTRSHGRLGVEHRIDPARGETRARAEARRRSRRRRPQGTSYARTRFKRARAREPDSRSTRDRSRDRARIEIARSSPTTTARGDDG